MVKLLVKNPSDGRYYFTDDEQNVQMIEYPFDSSQVTYVDTLPVFLRKSIDADFIGDTQEFGTMADFVDYAKQDCFRDSQETSVNVVSSKELKNVLVFAPLEVVMAYFTKVENMIANKDFFGIDMFIIQLSANNLIRNDTSLSQKLADVKASFEDAIFPHRDKDIVNKVKPAIKRGKKILSATHPKAS